MVVWDDGDDLHAEPRAPYPHTRETLLLRAEQQGAAALLGAFARSVEAAYLLRTGWAHEVAATRDTIRRRVTVQVAGATDEELARDPYARGARVPSTAFQVVRAALADGPVLVQTPRARLRPQPRLRALPRTGALPALLGPARPDRSHDPAGLPLVRHRRGCLGLRRLRPPRAAGTGAR